MNQFLIFIPFIIYLRTIATISRSSNNSFKIINSRIVSAAEEYLEALPRDNLFVGGEFDTILNVCRLNIFPNNREKQNCAH